MATTRQQVMSSVNTAGKGRGARSRGAGYYGNAFKSALTFANPDARRTTRKAVARRKSMGGAGG